MSEVSVEDRVLIRELYDTYYMAHDAGDAEAIRACFAPGGKLLSSAGQHRDADFFADTVVLWVDHPLGKTFQHHVTNLLVKPDEEGREDFRSARSYVLLTGVWEPPNIIVRWSCRTEDVVQFVDGRWRFATRRVVLNDPSTGARWRGEPLHVGETLPPGEE